MLSYNTQGNLNGNTISLNFKDFGYYSEESNEFVTIVRGNWDLSWKLNYKDVSKKFKVNKFISEKNNKSLITSINVSPISISANLIGKHSNNFMINIITFKDGTILTNDNFLGANTSTSFLKAFTSIELSEVINVNQIESITIGK